MWQAEGLLMAQTASGLIQLLPRPANGTKGRSKYRTKANWCQP